MRGLKETFGRCRIIYVCKNDAERQSLISYAFMKGVPINPIDVLNIEHTPSIIKIGYRFDIFPCIRWSNYGKQLSVTVAEDVMSYTVISKSRFLTLCDNYSK